MTDAGRHRMNGLAERNVRSVARAIGEMGWKVTAVRGDADREPEALKGTPFDIVAVDGAEVVHFVCADLRELVDESAPLGSDWIGYNRICGLAKAALDAAVPLGFPDDAVVTVDLAEVNVVDFGTPGHENGQAILRYHGNVQDNQMPHADREFERKMARRALEAVRNGEKLPFGRITAGEDGDPVFEDAM